MGEDGSTKGQAGNGSAAPKPEPAVGQVWCATAHGHPFTIRAFGEERCGRVVLHDGGYTSIARLAETGECIGVETPCGRVMVGERRRVARMGVATLARVARCRYTHENGAPGFVLRFDGEDDERANAVWNVAVVASWPLVGAPDRSPCASCGAFPCACRVCKVCDEWHPPGVTCAPVDPYAANRKREEAVLATFVKPAEPPPPRPSARTLALRSLVGEQTARQVFAPPMWEPIADVVPGAEWAGPPRPDRYPERRDSETVRVLAAVTEGQQAWSEQAAREIGRGGVIST